MAEQWELDEEGIRRLGTLTMEQPELVESLSLQGSYAGKIHSIGDAFRNFKNLRSLDLSRNLITSLKGIQYLCSLQDLNLYYNNIPSLVEVSRLQPLPFLKELDLRLNPVVRKDTDYRLFAVYTLQTLEKLDDRTVREGERKAAKLHFSQLGNSENFLLEVEKSSREKTMKNCVTGESSASKVSANVDSRIEMDSNKGLFIPFPNREIKDSLSTSATQGNGTPDQKLDTFPLGTQTQEVARREMPSDNHQEDVTWVVCTVCLETTVPPSLPEPPMWPLSSDSSWSLWISTGMAPAPSSSTRSFSESLKQKLVRVLEENLILSEKIQQLEEGAAISIVSGQQSHTYDDLLHKNQQLTMQVACLNQELAQLKKLEETVAILHESQRSLVVTNEYLLQQLNKEPKGYSGKALLPPEKGHHLGRSSPFGKSTLSSSPVAHDTGQYLIQSVLDAAPEPGL
ncbi:leucine-rich repeat-containing protein 36 isoform X6 [Gorilla gorilla gorilla]|uniref:leucine-rich repeat-containing protein 36 isoform X6 n=1 Tax=Gorilla gorilla gorilla TaxID=9595 RepID=UPI00123EAF3C|nr:leucine-rich repeat-containing protein 36 isoform X5 [Gorilla gorilla gorilla]